MEGASLKSNVVLGDSASECLDRAIEFTVMALSSYAREAEFFVPRGAKVVQTMMFTDSDGSLSSDALIIYQHEKKEGKEIQYGAFMNGPILNMYMNINLKSDWQANCYECKTQRSEKFEEDVVKCLCGKDIGEFRE
jgi:hypothetical protein